MIAKHATTSVAGAFQPRHEVQCVVGIAFRAPISNYGPEQSSWSPNPDFADCTRIPVASQTHKTANRLTEFHHRVPRRVNLKHPELLQD